MVAVVNVGIEQRQAFGASGRAFAAAQLTVCDLHQVSRRRFVAMPQAKHLAQRLGAGNRSTVYDREALADLAREHLQDGTKVGKARR